VRSTIAAKNEKRTEERRKKVALNERTKVSGHISRGFLGKLTA